MKKIVEEKGGGGGLEVAKVWDRTMLTKISSKFNPT